MLKTILVAFVTVVVVGLAAWTVLSTSRAEPKIYGSAKPAQLPGGWPSIRDGLSQVQVVALVGKPLHEGANRHFEQKTPAEWVKIQAEADTDASATNDLNSSISPKDIRLNAELEHRIKSLWQYSPVKGIDAVLSFDEQGNLMRFDYIPAVQPAMQGGSTSRKGAG